MDLWKTQLRRAAALFEACDGQQPIAMQLTWRPLGSPLGAAPQQLDARLCEKPLHFLRRFGAGWGPRLSHPAAWPPGLDKPGLLRVDLFAQEQGAAGKVALVTALEASLRSAQALSGAPGDLLLWLGYTNLPQAKPEAWLAVLWSLAWRHATGPGLAADRCFYPSGDQGDCFRLLPGQSPEEVPPLSAAITQDALWRSYLGHLARASLRAIDVLLQ
ncbi:hypothetical protein Pla175_28240 [Pirellulimonas nuda]|uniref:Uncharacterized protein n=1 Tax=Pirellulimonas nuda TaxID=2528009 RepID=A0A518DD76_9BACT|nr:hypothetical protein [Pirellulimonas nuda]QDU89434.1 hypothetical protein Pla175_28240 [Pirellulimonas nuda]